jgi:regulator of replication initiation timing
VNRFFLVYTDLMQSDDLRVEFQKIKGGVYSEEVEDILDNLLFSKYIDVYESGAGEGVDIVLTDKGYDHVSDIISKEDSPLINQINLGRSIWDRLTEQGTFVSYVHDKFHEYSNMNQRSKFREFSSSPEKSGARAVPVGAYFPSIYDAVNNIVAQLNSQYSQIANIRTIVEPVQVNLATLNVRLESMKKVRTDIEQLQKQINHLARSLKVQTKPTKGYTSTRASLKKVSRKRSTLNRRMHKA